MVDVNGTHVNVLLVAAGPDSFHFEVKLGKGASRYLMIKVAEEIEFFFVANECPFNLFSNMLYQESI